MNNVSGLQINELVETHVSSLREGDEFVVNGEVPVYTVVERLPHGATGMTSLLCSTAINKRQMTLTFYAMHIVWKVVK